MTAPQLVLKAERCTGCGQCVPICPVDCLAQSVADGLPWLVRPRACVDCSACVLVCPEKALEWKAPPPEPASP
ncbi:MAG: 4Fe-4S dicluster domain-containing protein [Gemmataceae bacterium]